MAKKKIESLTPEQTTRFPEFVEKWTAIGLCTEPSDRPMAEAGIALAYKAANLTPPDTIIWYGSPMAMAMSIARIQDGAPLPAENYRYGDQADWTTPIPESMKQAIGEAARGCVYGQHEAGWLSFYDYFREVCGLVEETEPIMGLTMIAKSAGWFAPYEEACFISERHSLMKRDERGLLHCEDGPALAYPDGWEIWSIHGILVDEQIVMRPLTQTVDQMDSEKNQDVRSIRITRFGWVNYLKESKATLLDNRKNDVSNTLEALFRTGNGEVILVANCSTGRTFSMPVPPDTTTCEQAQQWLQGGLKYNLLAAT